MSILRLLLSSVRSQWLNCLEHKITTLDAQEFSKIVIDWCIFECFKQDSNSTELRSRLPKTLPGGIYFYNPEKMVFPTEQSVYTAHEL